MEDLDEADRITLERENWDSMRFTVLTTEKIKSE